MCDLSFCVISDSHITSFGDEINNFSKTLKYYSENHKECNLYVFNGDIVYQVESYDKPKCEKLNSECYDIANAEIEKYIPEKRKLFVLGNHEFPQGNTEEKITYDAFSMWSEKFSSPIHEHITVSGYHFIKMGAYSWDFTVGDAEEEWAVAEIEKAKKDNDLPIFVFHHGSIPDTVAYSENSTLFSKSFCDYLKKQPRVIFTGGHEHSHFLDEKAIFQNGFTMISAPMCAGVSCFDGCDFLKPRVECVSQSLFFEVTKNKVNVYRVDNSCNKVWKEAWEIDVDENKRGIYKYGKDRKENYPKNGFKPDAKINAYAENDSIMLDIEQSFLNNTIVEYYDISVCDTAGKEIYRTKRHTDFYKLSMNIEQDKIYKTDIPKPDIDECVISVKPLNCFFETFGEALSVKVKL